MTHPGVYILQIIPPGVGKKHDFGFSGGKKHVFLGVNLGIFGQNCVKKHKKSLKIKKIGCWGKKIFHVISLSRPKPIGSALIKGGA